MTREAVVRRYLKAMERSDIEAVCRCFEPEGVIVSPVYGVVPVRPFYQRLFADTQYAEVDLYCLYSGIDQPELLAAHFGYVWLKTDGSRVETDLVDLFRFRVGGDLIARLAIIFDTAAKPAVSSNAPTVNRASDTPNSGFRS